MSNEIHLATLSQFPHQPIKMILIYSDYELNTTNPIIIQRAEEHTILVVLLESFTRPLSFFRSKPLHFMSWKGPILEVYMLTQTRIIVSRPLVMHIKFHPIPTLSCTLFFEHLITLQSTSIASTKVDFRWQYEGGEKTKTKRESYAERWTYKYAKRG